MSVLKDAINKFGRYSQLEKLIEEASEVIQATQKYKRSISEETEDHLCEELADLSIMIDQMYLIFPGKVEVWKVKKLDRLKERIKE